MSYSFITDAVVKNLLSKSSNEDLISLNSDIMQAIMEKYKVTGIDNLRSAFGLSTAVADEPVDSKEPLDSQEMFDAITVLLYDETDHLLLQILLKGKEVYSKKLGREPRSSKAWYLDDLGSGVSSAGDYYLSLNVYADDDVDGIPTYMEIAIVIRKDGTYSVENFKPWGNQEGGMCASFSADADGFMYQSF